MIRAFIDASVLFAACYSETGASRALLLAAIDQQIHLILSDVVQQEARRNLMNKAPQAVTTLEQLFDLIPFEVVIAPQEVVQSAQQYTELKDAPIVAAAIVAGADYLVSLDRAHLVDVSIVAESSGIPTVLPGEMLHLLRNVASDD